MISNEPGIYRIVNTVNETTYIGSSFNVKSRWSNHKAKLRSGSHINPHLQSAWKKYGEHSFTFEPLVTCAKKSLGVREQEFIDAYRDHGMSLYNLRPSALSRTGFNLPISGETRSKISQSNTRYYANNPDARAKVGARSRLHMTGKKLSQDTRDKMSRSGKGRVFSPEHRARISASRMGKFRGNGKKHSPETKTKLSASSKEWCRLNRKIRQCMLCEKRVQARGLCNTHYKRHYSFMLKRKSRMKRQGVK